VKGSWWLGPANYAARFAAATAATAAEYGFRTTIVV
jgi:hypothetical protein